MGKKAKLALCIAAALLMLFAVVFQDQLTIEANRMDVHRGRTVHMPPAYLHNSNISAPDVVIFDISGTNPRFTATSFEWNYPGGALPEINFTTITPGENLIYDAFIDGSSIYFVPSTGHGRGTAAITISVGDDMRTAFVKFYDLSLRLVALEFDDGPSAYTERIVKALNNAGVSASFYMTGKNFRDIAHEYVGVEIFPQAAVLAFATGHHVGNHTYSHPWMSAFSEGFHEEFPQGQFRPWWQYDEDEVLWQVARADEAIYAVLGVVPTYFAPPYFFGGHNSHIIAAGKTISSRHFSVDVGDWWWGTTVEDIVDRVLGARQNSTVVLHDIYEKTAEAIEIIMSAPQAQEIQFVTGFEMDMILGR